MILSKGNVRVISLHAPEFPSLLREIPDPPSVLYVCGTLPSPSFLHVALVGTRKATPDALRFTESLAASLAERGVVIVSGLALGVDGAAHRGALRVGGRTIAVLPNGLPEIYPRTHHSLAEHILESSGALVSEQSPSTPALPHHFLSRNRIISGLSTATIVIEAPIHSGSLVTARRAAEQGRDVLVVPGPHTHPHYRGSHALIRDGARLAASIEDILEDLSLTSLSSSPLPVLEDADQLRVFSALREAGEPLSIDKLLQTTTLEPPVLARALTFLVFKNIIKETERGYTL